MKRLLALAISLTLLAFVAAGCKTSSTSAGAGSSASATATASASAGTSAAPASCPSQATGFAKTRFVVHAALAFGAFHRYIYKPFKTGAFRSGAHGRFLAFIKAGLAALFVKREVRLALVAAQQSPALCKLILTPLRQVSDSVQTAVDKLRSGDTSGITGVQNGISQAEASAASKGIKIAENLNIPLG